MNNSRRTILAANWKLNNLWEDCEQFVSELHSELPQYWESGAGPGLDLDLVLCPAFPYIGVLGSLLEDARILLGAQHVSEHPAGAFTGEVSAAMLADSGCDFCIVGHSERRSKYPESAATMNAMLKLLREEEIAPILCVGEPEEVHRSGRAAEYVSGQLEELGGQIRAYDPEDIVVAYEPVWAIGTGNSAQPQEAGEMIGGIRRWLAEKVGGGFAESTLLLYGGSVNAGNIAGYITHPEIDGALIGGASQSASGFSAIARACLELRRQQPGA